MIQHLLPLMIATSADGANGLIDLANLDGDGDLDIVSASYG